MTDWVLDGVLPVGAILLVADPTDGTPEEVLACTGADVVVHFGRTELDEEPVLVTVAWREGLVPGQRPPAPYWIRFDPERFDFVPVEGAA
jgi:hypothetical protein